MLIKSEQLADKAKRVFGNSVTITTDGKRHLGAVIGTENCKEEYCEKLPYVDKFSRG